MVARKKAISLIEILIVFSLVGLLVVITPAAMGQLYKEQKFVHEVSKVKDALKLTQELMIDTRDEYTLTLIHEDEELLIAFASKKELAEALKARIEGVRCKKVAELSFEGLATKELTLHFEGHLGIISEGEIKVTSNKGRQEIIRLHGFPGRCT